ncbi:MAG: DUF262 domain-containing protein, partial [Clostridiales Family XIII bacterium]|nr:DUF262 domain-containing protein [Clostridiales Family XIII bacterium]
MEAVTTIRRMLAGTRIFVPSYQRAYSWDIDSKDTPSKQISTFISDLEQHCSSKSNTSYYFGHFLFENKGESHYAIIDGQQRLTTIVIFLSAAFRRLSQMHDGLREDENELREDIIKRNSTYRFETVDYDLLIFKDYVIDNTKSAFEPETTSAERIKNAYDYFFKLLAGKDDSYITNMVNTIVNASCTTHIVSTESEAVQMFIFQNNRGKQPTLLEIVKAELMFAVHIFADGDSVNAIINEIKDRFEKIYKSISEIEDDIDEDDILLYTLRVYLNSLWIERVDVIKNIKAEVKRQPVQFAKDFSLYLEDSFTHMVKFFTHDNVEYEIASIIESPTTPSRGGLPWPYKGLLLPAPKRRGSESQYLCRPPLKG